MIDTSFFWIIGRFMMFLLSFTTFFIVICIKQLIHSVMYFYLKICVLICGTLQESPTECRKR